MKRFALPVVAILLLAGCAGQPPVDDLPPASPPMFAEPGVGESAALGLVNLWRVTGAEGEGEETWLRLDAQEFQLWRDCGMINGSWAATDTIFLGEAWGAMGDCATDGMPVVGWLNQVVGFAATAEGYDLLAADGSVVASLSIDGVPEPIPTAAEYFAEPPEITAEVRAQFAAPAPLTVELESATADALQGTWVSPTIASTNPHVAFAADGTWTGSDGCNGGSGRWAVDGDGGFLATSGPSTLMFCEGAPIPSWVAQAASAGFDADGLLHLFNASGNALGSLAR